MRHAIQRMPLEVARPARPLQPSPGSRATRAEAAAVLADVLSAKNPQELLDPDFNRAVRLYENCHWALAFEQLTVLADAGHLTSARLSLLMMRYGGMLYGVSFTARSEQVARWAQRVLRASSRATASPSSITASA